MCPTGSIAVTCFMGRVWNTSEVAEALFVCERLCIFFATLKRNARDRWAQEASVVLLRTFSGVLVAPSLKSRLSTSTVLRECPVAAIVPNVGRAFFQ